MIRSLKTALEAEQMKYAVPQSVQVTIPVHTVHGTVFLSLQAKVLRGFLPVIALRISTISVFRKRKRKHSSVDTVLS
jgi:hypothetical protein